MMKWIFSAVFSWLMVQCLAQTPTPDQQKLMEAQMQMKDNLARYGNCLIKGEMDACITDLIKSAGNEYQKYLVATMLFKVDREKSFQVYSEIYTSKPDNLDFQVQFALGLHQKGEYAKAVELYEKYSKERPDDHRVNIWLADCYIRLNKIEKAIESWEKADPEKNRPGVDQSIFDLYDQPVQVKHRTDLRKEVEQDHTDAFYELIYLDMNWKQDWWKSMAQMSLVKEDTAFAAGRMKSHPEAWNLMNAYVSAKILARTGSADTIRKVLLRHKLILEDYPIPSMGAISSDLLNICFAKKIISEEVFYKKRGAELLKMAMEKKDKELLNVYAYLQARVKGKVDASVEKSGWKEFKDERFAFSYLLAKSKTLKSKDPELAEALLEFPNSAKLLALKVDALRAEKKPSKQLLLELICKEFKTLDSDPSRSSASLNLYFKELKTEK